jgi:hypothetical protein
MRPELIYCAVALALGFALGATGNIAGWSYGTVKVLLATGIIVGVPVVGLLDPTMRRRIGS